MNVVFAKECPCFLICSKKSVSVSVFTGFVQKNVPLYMFVFKRVSLIKNGFCILCKRVCNIVGCWMKMSV